MKKVLFTLSLMAIYSGSMAGTFTSIASGSFFAATTWSSTGDTDGIPDQDDDVTIAAGHTVSLGSTLSRCRDLTINATGRISSTSISFSLVVYGDYINSGSEQGTGTIQLNKTNGSISGSGVYSTGFAWNFVGNTTIASTVTVSKSVKSRIKWGTTVTNQGSVTLLAAGQMVGDAASATWLNGATGTVTLRTSNFMTTGIKNFTTAGNTLNMQYTGALLTVSGNTYGNLGILSGTTTVGTTITLLGNLSISASTTLNLGANNINIGGNVTINGTFTQTAGQTVTLNGSAMQTWAGNATLTNLTVNNTGAGVSFTSGTITVSDYLTVTDGNVDGGGATFTLLSDATKTAVIAQSGAGASFSGTFVLQRFISARSAGYSDMASSVSNTTFNDWGSELVLIYGYNPPDDYPSVYGYNESIWDYVPVTSSATTIDPGVGYEVYLDSEGDYVTMNSTIVTSNGTPNVGDLDMSGYVTFDNDGWNLLGNPYHANIDWDALQATTTDISGDIMFYDEGIADFETVSAGSGALIAPNQGFWVNVTGASPSITFTEAIKSSSTSSTYRNTPAPLFTLRLKAENGVVYTSGTKFRFNEQAEGKLPFKKLPHPDAPALYSLVNEKPLKINALNANEAMLDILLGSKVGKEGFYTIEASNIESALGEGYTCMIIEDTETGKKQDLSTGNFRYYAAAGTEKRFVLHLSKDNACEKSASLATTEVNNIEIYQANNEVNIEFALSQESNAQIMVTNLLGQPILPVNIPTVQNQTVKFNVPADFNGVFLVSVIVNGEQITKKFYTN